MEGFINPFQDLEPMSHYIRRTQSLTDESDYIDEDLYFIEQRDDLAIFLVESKFVDPSTKANLIKSTKNLKILTSPLSQKTASSKGYFLIAEYLRDLELMRGSKSLSRIPDEIHTDKCKFHYYTVSGKRIIKKLKDSEPKPKNTMVATVPCYSYVKLNVLADCKEFFRSFTGSDKKYVPIQPIFEKITQDSEEIELSASGYRQVSFSLTDYKIPKKMDFLNLDEIQTESIFEIINPFKKKLNSYISGNKMLLSVSSVLVKDKNIKAIPINLSLNEFEPKFTIVHVTNIHPDSEGKKMQVSHSSRKVNFNFEYKIDTVVPPEYEDDFPAYKWVHKLDEEYLETAPSYVLDSLKEIRPDKTRHCFNLIGNCAYLFESYGSITVAPEEQSYNKPFLLTIIYLFEEEAKMITEDSNFEKKTS